MPHPALDLAYHGFWHASSLHCARCFLQRTWRNGTEFKENTGLALYMQYCWKNPCNQIKFYRKRQHSVVHYLMGWFLWQGHSAWLTLRLPLSDNWINKRQTLNAIVPRRDSSDMSGVAHLCGDGITYRNMHRGSCGTSSASICAATPWEETKETKGYLSGGVKADVTSLFLCSASIGKRKSKDWSIQAFDFPWCNIVALQQTQKKIWVKGTMQNSEEVVGVTPAKGVTTDYRGA